MNFDQAFYSNLKETEAASTPPTAQNQLNNVALVEQAWKSYQAAIEATKQAKNQVSEYKNRWARTLEELIAFYSVQNVGNPIDMATTYMQKILTELVKRVNEAIAYEEAKRQSYVSISAANNVPTYSTVATAALDAQTEITEAIAAASQATGLSPATLGIIAAVVIIIVLILILK